jgi:hypothetical protein
MQSVQRVSELIGYTDAASLSIHKNVYLERSAPVVAIGDPTGHIEAADHIDVTYTVHPEPT